MRAFIGTLSPGARIDHELPPGRHAWLQVMRGSVRLGDVALDAGDGASSTAERALQIASNDGAEVLLFDLR